MKESFLALNALQMGASYCKMAEDRNVWNMERKNLRYRKMQ